MLMGTHRGHSKSLPPSGVIPTSLARVLGKPQNSPGGEFRVSPRYLPCSVSLPGDGTRGEGVDERIESASGRPTWFVLLDVNQVERLAPIRPLVEPHRSVASFDDPNQAPDEVDAERTVFPLAVTSVDLYGDWLIHAFSSDRGSGRNGGGQHRPNPAVTETLTPRASEVVKRRRRLR